MADDLGPRGQRLWADCEKRVDGERGLVLLEEACRISDRLDKLNTVLTGDVDTWLRLVEDATGETYEIRVDSALIEARQQASVLRQLLVSLPMRESGDADPADAWLDRL